MTSPFRWPAAVCAAALLAAAADAPAQQNPQIGYVYPAGARQGAEIEVAVGGQYLNGVLGAVISGKGVEAMVTDYIEPESKRRQAEARRRRMEEERKRMEAAKTQPAKAESPKAASLLEKFAKQKSPDGPDLRAIVAAVRRQQQAAAKRQPNPQLSETVMLYLTVERDAECGVRELRLQTPAGLSNPLYFHVGQCEEYSENEPNDQAPDAGVPQWRPITINGQIMPGDVDRFRFRAEKGARLVAAVSARSLIPYLADAVPGWFQATLTLSDAGGNQLAYVDDFRFDPDPVIHYQVPATGEYVLEIKDAIFRGREDFVYRITLGEAPFVTGVFPLGGRAGAKTAVQLDGWNLPTRSLTVDAAGHGPGILTITRCAGERLVRPVPFALDTLPECLEGEPNDGPSRPQRVTPPVIVNGRIDRPGDRDVFAFTGRAGEKIVAEVIARRLGSPLDSLLTLTDAAGRLLEANDDHEDKGAGLTTHHADSLLAVTLPKDGTFLLHLGDTQHKGGPAYAYRLRIGPPRCDFDLRVTPASLNARPGATVPITVYALRKDGFDGDIALRLKGMSMGFELGGGWVPAGQDKARCTLTVPHAAQAEPVRLSLEGRAAIDGREVLRPAAPAEDMMQAFAYRHLVPAEAWLVSVTGGGTGFGQQRPVLRMAGDGPVKVPAGGTVRFHVSVTRAGGGPVGGGGLRGPGAGGAPGGPRGPVGAGWLGGLLLAQVRLELSEPPEGIAIKQVSPDRGGLAVVLSAEDGKAKPGLKGNLIAEAIREWTPTGPDGKPVANKRRLPLGALPAIPFEVVAAAKP